MAPILADALVVGGIEATASQGRPAVRTQVRQAKATDVAAGA